MSHPKPVSSDTVRVEVLKLVEGMPTTLRTLSPSYCGLFTHFTTKGSVLCDPGACPGAIHSLRQIWKGYAAVEVWLPQRGRWIPSVLELTEHLELDMRDLYERGQVWEVMRPKTVKKKHFPVTGKLLSILDPTKLREAFDFRPILRTLYHVQEIALGIKNPLPPRVYLEPSQDAPPMPTAGPAKEPAPEPTREFIVATIEKCKRAGLTWKSWQEKLDRLSDGREEAV